MDGLEQPGQAWPRSTTAAAVPSSPAGLTTQHECVRASREVLLAVLERLCDPAVFSHPA